MTEWTKNAINPSARKGDKAQIAYDDITGKMTPQIGVPPETVALACAQAVLLRKELQDETIFVVPDKGGDKSRAGTAQIAALLQLV